MSKKIGLFGGTFDPVHNGHILIAKTAYKELNLDEIWFLPELTPKFKHNVTDYSHRLNMLKLATKKYDFMIVDKLDMQKHGKNYDISALKELIELYPQNHYMMIMGSDTFANFPKWKDAEKFAKLTEFYIFPRQTQVFNKKKVNNAFLNNIYVSKISPNKFLNLASSSFVRSNILDDINKDLLPTDVLKYALTNKLYLNKI